MDEWILHMLVKFNQTTPKNRQFHRCKNETEGVEKEVSGKTCVSFLARHSKTMIATS